MTGSTLCLVGACLGWARSGTTVRNSFALVQVGRSLGLFDGPAARLAPLWFLLPAVVGSAWLGLGLRRPLVVNGVGLLAAVATLSAGWLVRRTPLPVQGGLTVAALGAVVALLGVAVGALATVAPSSLLTTLSDDPRPVPEG